MYSDGFNERLHFYKLQHILHLILDVGTAYFCCIIL